MPRLNPITTALTLSLLASAISFSCPAAAEVTQLEIASSQSYGTFSAGEFMLLEGRVVGELKPTEAFPISTRRRGMGAAWSITPPGFP